MAEARGAGGPAKAILLDRDGTLIEDPGYLSRPEQVVWKDGAIEALKRFKASGYRLFIVSNQSGIGRGFFTSADLENVQRRIERDLAAAGVKLDGVYYCPHAPDEACECRKPKPGLVLQAAREHGLGLSQSWLIGDKCSDVAAGQAAKMMTALVYSDAACTPAPNIREATLCAAAARILKNGF